MKTPTKTPLIVGNWKMHKTGAEAAHFFATLPKEVTAAPMRICIAAPFTAISAAVFVAQALNISIGGQNAARPGRRCLYWGNFLRHAEGGWSGVRPARSFRAAPLVRRDERLDPPQGQTSACRGDNPHPLYRRDFGRERKRWARTGFCATARECLLGLTQEEMLRIAIAYEPVWAIGTGKTATPEIAQETHQFIREWLAKQYGEPLSSEIYLLYGGSVKPDNTAVLMQQKDIDGVLVGGASLDPKNFAQIINYSRVSL